MFLEVLGTKISTLWAIYQPLAPMFLVAFVVAILAAPAAGRIAARLGAMDLPAHLRKRTDSGLERNINTRILPRLGGLAMAFSIIYCLLVFQLINESNWGVLVGILIIVVYGILDDVRDIPSKYQLLGQFLAALVVVISGISVYSIQIAGVHLDFATSSHLLHIGNIIYTLVLPADLLTILWIVAVINFVNWMSGMDGLNHMVTSVASFMILLVAVDAGNLAVAGLVTVHLGANLGAGFFNYPPAKIFPGAVGEHLNGFLLAVFAVMSGSKLPLALIALTLPIVDAFWVMFNRFRKGRSERKSWKAILQSLTKADTNHLHHRLMSLGFSWKAILGIEVGITVGLSAIGFWLAGFRDEFVALIGSIAILITVIGGIYAYSRYKEKKQSVLERIQPKPEAAPTIEVVYRGDEQGEKFVY